MSTRTLKILMAASLALNVGFVGTAAYQHLSGRLAMKQARPVSLAERLGMSAGQRSAWETLERPFLQDLSVNWAAIRALRKSLLDEMFAKEPNREVLSDLQAQIATLQDGQQKRVITQVLLERSILDAHQQALLKDLLAQEYGAQAAQVEHLHQAEK